MSKRENTATLYLYVKEYVMKLLVSGKYPPNTKLPTEFELMKELNVGRATVREALTRLENEGFIYKRQGIGTFVAENSEFSIHPFASFSYTAHSLGFNDTITVLKEESFKVDKNNHELLERWDIGVGGKTAYRTRIIENAPVAIDTVYVLEIANNIIGKDFSFRELIDDKFNKTMKSNIDHLATDVYKRKPTEEEAKLLKMSTDEDVVEIRRWMYSTSICSMPVAFTHIVINSRMFKLQKDFRLTK